MVFAFECQKGPKASLSVYHRKRSPPGPCDGHGKARGSLLTSVRFLPEGKRVRSEVGEDMLSTARRGNVDFQGPCAGRALCARCLLRVIEGGHHLSEATADERLVLSESQLAAGHRLGCRCRLTGEADVTVFISSQSRLGTSVLLSEGMEAGEELDPAVVRVRIPAPHLSNDWLKALSRSLGVDPSAFTEQALGSLTRAVREGQAGDLTLVRRRGEFLDARSEGRLLGLAVDLGTTKVAGYLIDLEEGKTLSVATDVNPQIAYGEDVIARLTYALQGGRDELQAKVVDCINSMVERTCRAAGTAPSDIYEFVIVGNTVMHHLLLNLEPKTIAYAPYAPASTASTEAKGASLRLAGNGESRVFLPPLVAGYVGSDAVADMMTTGMHENAGPSMLIDIGTNTEIVVKNSGKCLACSAASGPAFEGAHIAFGMRAATGAIDSVKFSPDAEPAYTVIGGTKPRGLTGSAVVDALAGMFEVGIVDGRGTFVADAPSARLRRDRDGRREFVIADKSETENRADITLRQGDIREIQLAKAAIRAGTDVLLKRAGLEARELRVVYVAGAFGFYLNPASAMKLGLYPEMELDRVRMVGNTAVTGAKAILLSMKTRSAADRVAAGIEYVELANDADFRHEFLNAMSIPYAGDRRFPRLSM